MIDRGEVIAYLIMESASDPVKPQNIKVSDKQGLFFVKFDATLQSLNRQNRNRRDYKSFAMIPSLAAPHIKELQEKGSWCGEAGHPMSDDVKRILTIEPKYTSHRINSFWMKGNDILQGNIETLDDNSLGTKFTKNILQGLEPAFSLRALAKLTKFPDGSAIMQSKCHIVCYDWVILPSHIEAYRDQSKPIQKIVKDLSMDTPNILTESSSIIELRESQVKDFIKLESRNLRAVSNVYDIAMESMQLASSGKHVIVKEGTSTFMVKIEDHIKHEVRNFMGKL